MCVASVWKITSPFKRRNSVLPLKVFPQVVETGCWPAYRWMAIDFLFYLDPHNLYKRFRSEIFILWMTNEDVMMQVCWKNKAPIEQKTSTDSLVCTVCVSSFILSKKHSHLLFNSQADCWLFNIILIFGTIQLSFPITSPHFIFDNFSDLYYFMQCKKFAQY